MAATTTRTNIGGLTIESTSGEVAVVKLPGFGTACREMAAKVVDGDGRTVAVILEPWVRWHRAPWYRDSEWHFQANVKRVAEHFGGTAVLVQNPL